MFTMIGQAHGRNYSGRLVDENLIILRKRIHERNMVEMNDEPPMEWMNWEKQVYTSYDSIICDGMRLIQSYLIETRPSLALGMIALITLSVPTSTVVESSKVSPPPGVDSLNSVSSEP
ncbi:hypothetical protein BUALT_Bualt05G0114800 [Buddleja alternifolia]|uniref:Uncharacterized protein n=1 Tax=Buddleja alternifolia TaxID=168488 RepID=A0AAV6XIL1_9LAMI|nr:hypothetical protein BUALT_Bualt05G0114800 [Buddleja alternifolia]